MAVDVSPELLDRGTSELRPSAPLEGATGSLLQAASRPRAHTIHHHPRVMSTSHFHSDSATQRSVARAPDTLDARGVGPGSDISALGNRQDLIHVK